MMNFRKLASTSFLLITVCFAAFSQQDSVLNAIISKTTKLSTEHPLEKVYLHFDKPYYSVGDTIWFKAYLTSDQHQPSSISKIVYVDLINDRDSLVQSLKLRVVDGTTFGNIALPQFSFKQGNYHLIAYTNWMRNFDTDYFFHKTIPIGNLIDNELLTHISLTNSIKDNLVKINARILYKDQEGKPYADKKVNWKVETGTETVSKGKGTTDLNGFLAVSLSNNQASALSAAELITVIEMGNKKLITKSFPLKTVARPVDVQFFPEGGELISDIPAKIAIKVTKSDGLGLNIKGIITNKEGKEVANFSSEHLGMGSFLLQPESGNSYKASINFPDGSQSTYDLPKVQPSGFNLSVNNSDPENLTIKLLANSLFFQDNKNKKFYIVAQSGGVINYAAQTTLSSLTYTASVPKSKFPTGIVQLSLFSASGKPLSERIAFIQHDDLLNISINSGRTSYARRQKVQLNVSAKNKTSQTESSLSIAVIDESKVPFDENAETTILTNLLLTSDLKGYIEKPNYYFKKLDDKTRSNLDLLMLTQGYRRFSYTDILADKYPSINFLPELGIEISGTLRTLNGMPINRGNVRLLVPGKNPVDVVTNSSGIFKFSSIVVTDSTKVTINARNNTNNKNLMIMLDGVRTPNLSVNSSTADEIINIDSTLRTYLQNSKKQYFKSQVLKEVVVKATSTVKKPSHQDHGSLTGLSSMPDHLIEGNRLKDCGLFINCLKSMGTGLTFLDEYIYITRDYNAGNKTPVQVYLDGMPVDINYLNSVVSTEVESVEIFQKDGLSGINRMNNTNGVVVINTKKVEKGAKVTQEQLSQLFPPKYLVTLMPGGYNTARVFYSPKYDPKINPTAVDYRSTIYWNPELITDKTGNANFEYFNADGKGTYRVIIEGIDNDGHIGRYVYRYKVE